MIDALPIHPSIKTISVLEVNAAGTEPFRHLGSLAGIRWSGRMRGRSGPRIIITEDFSDPNTLLGDIPGQIVIRKRQRSVVGLSDPSNDIWPHIEQIESVVADGHPGLQPRKDLAGRRRWRVNYRSHNAGTLGIIVFQIDELLNRKIAFVNQQVCVAVHGKKQIIGSGIAGVRVAQVEGGE